MTKPIADAFWELLRCSLWNRIPNVALFGKLTDEEWNHIYSLVKKHAIIGITFLMLEKLPAESRPNRKLYLSWCGTALQIKNRSHHMNEVYHTLSEWLEHAGIRLILMKGLGIATCYPQPLLRMAGDIDIYIMKKDYAAAIKLIQQAGIPIKRTAEHDEFVYQGIQIELHTHTSHYAHIFENVRDTEIISEGDFKYRVPSAETNAILLIKHPARHMFTSGSAIRHLCDWAVFLQQNHNRISFSSLEEKLRNEGLERFAMTFTSLAVEYLGLSPKTSYQEWLRNSKKKQEEVLLNDLLEKGDCGMSDLNQRLSIEKLSFSWASCKGWMTYYGKSFFRLMKLSILFPNIIRRMIVERIGHRLKMVMIGKPFAPC